MIVSFAQNYEDVMLWRALKRVKQGRYLDIGAQDPIHDSVSKAFYDAGWRGVHVEASPGYAAAIRTARPDETVIEAAVCDAAKPIDFYEIPDTGLSTGNPEVAQHHGKLGHAVRLITVPVVRLSSILEQMGDGDIHWMKIDVEGMEAGVLHSWDDHAARPWVVVVESTYPTTQIRTDEEWHDLLDSRGYRQVHYDGLSSYYLSELHAELAEHFSSPPNIFDDFLVSPNHFTARQIVAQAHEREQELTSEIVALREDLTKTQGELGEAFRRNEGDARELETLRSAIGEIRQELTRVEAERESARIDLVRGKALLEASQGQLQRALHDVDNWRSAAAVAQTAAAEAAREHALSVERLWQGRSAEEEKLRRVSDAAIKALQLALEKARAAESAARVECARLDERSRNTELRLKRAEADLKHAQLAAAEERERAGTAVEAERERHARELEGARADFANELHSAQTAADQLRAELSRADALIRRAQAEPPGRWQRLGEILGASRCRGHSGVLASWSLPVVAPGNSPPNHQLSASESETNMLMPAVVDGRNPYLRANSLAELLSWYDVDFVRCAYVTVLGRQPDARGEEHYTHWLRRGTPKLAILRQMRNSTEGRAHDPGISGFDAELAKAARARLPIIGALLPDSSFEPQRRYDRPFRVMTNQIGLVNAHVTGLMGQVANFRDEMSSLTLEMNRLASATPTPPPVADFTRSNAFVSIEHILAAFGDQAHG